MGRARSSRAVHRFGIPSAAGVPSRPGGGGGRSLVAKGLALAAGVALAVGGWSLSLQVGGTPSASAAAPMALPAVQSLYAADLVARINAERAARAATGVPVPQLQVDAGLAADAQVWSAHLAATGTVSDPSLPPCGGAPNQVCVFAANSGSSGYGFWPGDGSDGMDSAYMASAPHRQNELGAAYTYVGVGVTCSGNQAWTVELFGYTYGDIPSAGARQATENAMAGDPVGGSPVVAGTPSGNPVYCPGQTYGPNGAVTPTGGQFRYPFAVPGVPGEPSGGPGAAVGMAATADGGGYWVARADGTVTPHGDAANYGSMAGVALNAPISHIVATADGRGYWLVAGDGGIFSFGDAQFYGSMGGQALNAPVVGIAPTSDGRGYWLVASDGGIFSFGDARFQGSMGGVALNAPVVGMATDRSTGGYWLVASDGGVFSFGAPFHGSTGAIRLNQPVVGMAVTGDSGGYWFVASDGGIFTFGDARFAGSAGNEVLNAPAVAMAGDPASGGYWFVAADGGVFSYGAPFFGAG